MSSSTSVWVQFLPAHGCAQVCAFQSLWDHRCCIRQGKSRRIKWALCVKEHTWPQVWRRLWVSCLAKHDNKQRHGVAGWHMNRPYLIFVNTAIFGLRIADQLSTLISDPRGRKFESRRRRIRLEQDLIRRTLSLALWIIAGTRVS